MGVGVFVGVFVAVGVGVLVGVFVGVDVSVGVGVFVGVFVGVDVSVGVGVLVGVFVAVGVLELVGVRVAVGVREGVGVGVSSGAEMVIFAVAVPLSTVASALPLPGVEPAVKVAVAMPFDWIVACALEMVPSTALPKLIGTPISAPRLAAAFAEASEFFRKSAVNIDVSPPEIVLGLAI